jgi:hypothetical protein
VTHDVWRQAQQLADVEEREWPGRVIGGEPAIGIEIEFPLDCACRACRTIEPSQILRGLFENSGCQLSLTRLGCITFGSVHVDLFVHFFLKLSKIDISEKFEELLNRG